MPLFANQGLGIALLSYCGRLSFGLVADWDVLPDLERVGRWIEDSFVDVRELALRVAEGAEEGATPSDASIAKSDPSPVRVTKAEPARVSV